jgi:hypothetical protein
MNSKIAIIVTVNDIKTFHGGSLSGIKKQISYIDQFLILYETVKKNWTTPNYVFEFYLFHSIPFSEEVKNILKKTDVTVTLVNYEKHKTKIRPVAYFYDIECDYRLVLDVDMIAVDNPVFDLNLDFQAMYGGNKYNKEQWEEICEFLNVTMPQYPIFKKEAGAYNSWSVEEMYLYNTYQLKEKIFPYFNNGAILIKNDISKKFVSNWEEKREKYMHYVKNTQNIEIDFEGQDIVGVVLNDISSNWKPFDVGFNFPLQEKFEKTKHLLKNTKTNASFLSLLHYINIDKESKWSNLIFKEYLQVRKKYYGDSKLQVFYKYILYLTNRLIK